jgi:GNAT superfamily N-acetyltransferase
VQIRKNPLSFTKEDKSLKYAVVQRFADVLEQELYISDPCGSLSTAFWKKEHFPMPENIEVVREKDLEHSENAEYSRYFKLMHNLKTIGNRKLPNGYCYRNVNLPCETAMVADFINHCYGYSFTSDEVLRWTNFPVYYGNLWVAICDSTTNEPVALGIADYDSKIGEGSLEWIQVLPDKRGLGFATYIVNELLAGLSVEAKFATVSGECDNPTNPEKLYRKCGFVGDEIWGVVTCFPG